MSQNTTAKQLPKGITRWLFRLPILLYKFGLGWILGQRFILINHVGRKSGLIRQAVVEVVKHEFETDIYYVVSGYGDSTNWYRNLLHQPDIVIQVGRKKLDARAVPLSPAESGAMMVDYAQHYPALARRLTGLLGYDVDGTDEAYYTLGRDTLKFVAFLPR